MLGQMFVEGVFDVVNFNCGVLSDRRLGIINGMSRRVFFE